MVIVLVYSVMFFWCSFRCPLGFPGVFFRSMSESGPTKSSEVWTTFTDVRSRHSILGERRRKVLSVRVVWKVRVKCGKVLPVSVQFLADVHHAYCIFSRMSLPLQSKSDGGLSTFADARHSGENNPMTSNLVIIPPIRHREFQKNLRTLLKISNSVSCLNSVLIVTRHRGYFHRTKYPIPSGPRKKEVHDIDGSVRVRPRSDRVTAHIRTNV